MVLFGEVFPVQPDDVQWPPNERAEVIGMVFTEHLIRSRMQFAASSVLLAGFTTCVVVFPFGHD